MRSGGLANKFLHDTQGSSLIEFTLVFPILIVVSLGTVDFTYMVFEWAQANKAAFYGARTAIISDPVDQGITALTYSTAGTELGQPCFTSTGGADSTASCPTVNTTCTPNPSPSTSGTCTSGDNWQETPFTNANGTGIFDKMRAVFPRLKRENVQIRYVTTGLGYVGQPNGLPMSVTVSIQNMTHQFYFIGRLWRMVSNPNMPTFATTLTSEDMCSGNNLNAAGSACTP
jgi:Flp pilus assembly protein TadG